MSEHVRNELREHLDGFSTMHPEARRLAEDVWKIATGATIEKCVEVVRDSAYSDEAMGLSCPCEKDGFDQGFCAAIRIASKALQALLEEEKDGKVSN